MTDGAALFDGLQVAILVIDGDGITTYANARLGGLLGIPADQLLGRPLLDFVLPADHSLVMSQLRTRRDGRSDSYDVRLSTNDGRILHARVHASPLERDGRVVGSIAAVIDLTDLATAAATREAALQEARAAAITQSRFVSWMSHELRTPLSTISGFAQLLHSNLPPGNERDMAESIVVASNHVNGLVRDLLDYSRADADALEPTLTPVSLRAVIDDALELVSGTARDLDVRVDVQVGDEQVVAVHRHLVQVLLNLLSNAVKYGGRGGTVRVRSAATDGRVTCSVTDQGPGIPTDVQRRAFQPFERLDNAKGVVGVGLGLSISEALTRAMKGTLTVSSLPGHGATFTIDLPLAIVPDDPQETARDNSPSGPQDHRLVLYVEDEPLNASLMESIVALLPGRRLQVEPTVAGGISAAAALRPALILLDIHLPDGSGFDVLRAVRADPATSATPVFVLSADATEQAARHALDLGVDRFITKPFNINEFVGLVDEVT